MRIHSPLQALLLACLVFITTDSTRAQEFPGFGGGASAKPCPPHRCPKDQTAVPKSPLRLTSTGCSGLGGGLQMMSPGSFGSDGGGAGARDPKDTCCDLRHACLQTCGSVKTGCDDDFQTCTQRVCAALPNPDEKKKCESSSSIHNLMISMDKCQKYSSAQAASCECVPNDKVPSRHERLLRNFYKKYSPESTLSSSLDKVPGLVKKVDSSPRKMAGLLLQLYKKYPQAIKKIKDPQQEMMEKMMKDADKLMDDDGQQESKVDESDAATVEESDAEDLGVDEL